jgi:hypothetical protein
MITVFGGLVCLGQVPADGGGGLRHADGPRLGDGHRLRRLPRIRVRRIQESHRRALWTPATSPLRATSPSPRGRRITSRSSRSSGGSSPGKGTTTGLVMSEKILTTALTTPRITDRTVSGSTVYPNNYQYSTLRAMLNGYDGSAYSVGNFTGKGFLDVAFTEAEKAYITTTTVDNSAATTESSSNSYACADTSDRIFALSYQDLLNTSYGFSSSTGPLRPAVASSPTTRGPRAPICPPAPPITGTVLVVAFASRGRLQRREERQWRRHPQ